VAKHMTYFVVQGMPNEAEFGRSWAARWQPRTDIYQTPEAIYIQLEAPGLDHGNLRLDYEPEPGQLIVEGRRERANLRGAAWPKTAHCIQAEIEYGPFRRVINLPPDIDSEAIAATYEAGLLLITIPHKKPSEPVNVRVSVS